MYWGVALLPFILSYNYAIQPSCCYLIVFNKPTLPLPYPLGIGYQGKPQFL